MKKKLSQDISHLTSFSNFHSQEVEEKHRLAIVSSNETQVKRDKE